MTGWVCGSTEMLPRTKPYRTEITTQVYCCFQMAGWVSRGPFFFFIYPSLLITVFEKENNRVGKAKEQCSCISLEIMIEK